MNGSLLNGSIIAFWGASGGETLVILLAMLLLFGSKKLPTMARTLGRTIEEFRRAAREVTGEIMRAVDEDPPRPKPLDQAVPHTSSAAKATPALETLEEDGDADAGMSSAPQPPETPTIDGSEVKDVSSEEHTDEGP